MDLRPLRCFLIASCLATSSLGSAQAPTQPHSGELALSLRRLGSARTPTTRTPGSLLWLSGARGLRTGYLLLTRGEGGQNFIGVEQNEALGLLRTYELLAARRIDQAEQLFGGGCLCYRPLLLKVMTEGLNETGS